jgi:hypothetical protein
LGNSLSVINGATSVYPVCSEIDMAFVQMPGASLRTPSNRKSRPLASRLFGK